MAATYFECVNERRHLRAPDRATSRGRTEVDPQQMASLATKLIEERRCRIVGSTSIDRCDVNGAYYEEQGYYLIIAGGPRPASPPNFSAVNMGPHYLSLGGAQAALPRRRQGQDGRRLPNVPGFDLDQQWGVEFAEANGPRTSYSRARSPTPTWRDSPASVQGR